MNVNLFQIDVEEIEIPESFFDSIAKRAPKLATFGLSDLYPSNILNIPTKLQQMVNEHLKSDKIEVKASSIVKNEVLSITEMNYETTTEPENFKEQTKIPETTEEIITKTSFPLVKELPIHEVASITYVEDLEDSSSDEQNSILHEQKSDIKLNFQPDYISGDWKPITPPDFEIKYNDNYGRFIKESLYKL